MMMKLEDARIAVPGSSYAAANGIAPARPIILTFAGAYLPGFKAGGPIRSLANMANQLGDDFDFRIVVPDRDLGDTSAYPGVSVDRWNVVDKAQVFYRSPGAVGWRTLVAALREVDYDLIYLNSFFSPASSLRPLFYLRTGRLLKRPVLLAPRGEFSPGALALKPIKKRVFLKLMEAFGFYSETLFQASSEHEAADIRRVITAKRIFTSSDISVSFDKQHSNCEPPKQVSNRRSGSPLKGVFLSRISPMKNLTGALSMLAQVSCPVEYDIYGPIEDQAYWAQCLKLKAALPAHVNVQYHGELRPEAVESVLQTYDFFFLPTLGENYGHVIREALSAGIPVLISDQTPWRNLAVASAGADLPLDHPEAFVAWIEALWRLEPEDWPAIKEAARGLGNDWAKTARDVEANRVMLQNALGRTEPDDRAREPR